MRPTLYTKELASRICEEIALGRTGTAVSREEWAPARSTVRNWANENPDFKAALREARLEGAHGLAEQCVDIADTERDAARSREMTSNRRWLASKIQPAVYGEKLDLRVETTIDWSAAREMARARVALLPTNDLAALQHEYGKYGKRARELEGEAVRIEPLKLDIFE